MLLLQKLHDSGQAQYEIYKSAAYLKRKRGPEFLQSVVRVLKSMHSGNIIAIDNFDEIFQLSLRTSKSSKITSGKR